MLLIKLLKKRENRPRHHTYFREGIRVAITWKRLNTIIKLKKSYRENYCRECFETTNTYVLEHLYLLWEKEENMHDIIHQRKWMFHDDFSKIVMVS